MWREIRDPSGVLGLCIQRASLFYEEIDTPVLWVCQRSQSVSHFKLNSIIKSRDSSGIEVCQNHITLLQINVNDPIPVSKLELLSNMCGCRACQPGWQHQDLCQVPISCHWPIHSILSNANLRQNQNELKKNSRNCEWCYLGKFGKVKTGKNHYVSILYKYKTKEGKTSVLYHFYKHFFIGV